MKDEFIQEVENGRKGKNTGLPGYKNVLSQLYQATNNIQKECYYVIGAGMKTGKTTFVDLYFILLPFLNGIPSNVKYIYFSFEINKKQKLARQISTIAFLKYSTRISPNKILGKGNIKLTDQEYDLVKKIYETDIQKLLEHVVQYEEKLPPFEIRNEIRKFAVSRGSFVGDKFNEKYVPNDPNEHVIVILDHAGKIKRTKLSDKNKIDEVSDHFVTYRNKCLYTFVMVQQLNRSISDIHRLKYTGNELQPMVSDFKESQNTQEDANIIMALFNPEIYKNITKHLGYDLNVLQNTYRSLHILASRDTEAPLDMPLYCDMEVGFMTRMPELNSQALKTLYDKLKTV